MQLGPDTELDLRNIDVKLSIHDIATISRAFGIVGSIIPQSREDIQSTSQHIADVLEAHFPELAQLGEQARNGDVSKEDIEQFLRDLGVSDDPEA